MKYMQKILLLCLSLGLGFIPTPASAAVPDQLQQLYDTAQYKPLLQQVTVELAKLKPKVDDADRYSLLVLKGEALIHTKANGAAADTFTAAALVGPDANSISIAKATALLLTRAGTGKYQPKTKPADAKTPPAAIDIINATSRKDAFAALLTDILEPIKPQLTNLESTTSLPSIENLAKQVSNARDVEIAGTGSDSQTKDDQDKLATRAADLMNNALKSMDEKISALTKNASRGGRGGRRTVTGGTNGSSGTGLSMANVTSLDNIVSEAREISDAAGKMIPIFPDKGDFKTIQSDAEKIITSANKLLTQYHYPAA